MKSWDEVRNDIFATVFQNMDTDSILTSQNLSYDGFLKSLSIILILSVLEEANPSCCYIEIAEAKDFLSMATIRALYCKGSEWIDNEKGHTA
jgi:hypothetical protein